MPYINIMFDGSPSHQSARFVEIQDAAGKSIQFGKLVQRAGGFWALRFNVSKPRGPLTPEQRKVNAAYQKKWLAANPRIMTPEQRKAKAASDARRLAANPLVLTSEQRKAKAVYDAARRARARAALPIPVPGSPVPIEHHPP
jgi:hypothetical protein